MITNGQARRIAAEWQTPRNAFSVFQCTGEITNALASDITDEIWGIHHRRSSWPEDEWEVIHSELVGLERFINHHGLGKVAPRDEWIKTWDDAPVTADQLGDY